MELLYAIEPPATISSRLPSDAVDALRTALARFAMWAKELPEESKLYLNQRPVLRRDVQSGGSGSGFEPDLAPVFFDYHSVLTSQSILRGWRIGQLLEGLATSISSWNITIAASAARSLVETACSWFVESRELQTTWNAVACQPIDNANALRQARMELMTSVTQVFAGTRLSHVLKIDKAFQRTNVLTHIKKAAKILDLPALTQQYEELCDAVHPSWGSTECFWAEAGIDSNHAQARILLNRLAAGQPGDPSQSPGTPGSGLGITILLTAAWACERLTADLEQFELLCRDVCLTCRIYTLPDLDYWKVVRPTGPNDACACGSGKRSRFCVHSFGRVRQ